MYIYIFKITYTYITYTYIYKITESLSCLAEIKYNIVSQLYFNKIKF